VKVQKRHILFLCMICIAALVLSGGCSPDQPAGGNETTPDAHASGEITHGDSTGIPDAHEVTPPADKAPEPAQEAAQEATPDEPASSEPQPEISPEVSPEPTIEKQPEPTPEAIPCTKEGQKISNNLKCCPGLQRVEMKTPATCTPTKTYICLKCGDGKCDGIKGENDCTCPRDCGPGPATTCKDLGGYCLSDKQNCRMGTKPNKKGKCTGQFVQCCAPPAITDCSNRKGYCIPQNTKCRSDYKLDTSVRCGSVRSLMCCMPRAIACKSDADCPRPACSGSTLCMQSVYKCTAGSCLVTKTPKPGTRCDAPTGKCVSKSAGCKSHCDCAQGLMCVKSSAGNRCIAGTKPTYCCSKSNCPSGKSCTYANGTSGVCPKGTKCLSDNDCGKPNCKNVKSDCSQVTPICDTKRGTCSTKTQTFSNTTCDTSSGKCHRSSVCKSHCDCAQGLMCAGGKCIAGFVPVYCCDNPGCPPKKSCTFRNGSKGTCP